MVCARSPAAQVAARAQSPGSNVAHARPSAAFGGWRGVSSSSSSSSYQAAVVAGAGDVPFVLSGVKSSAFADSYKEAVQSCVTDTMAQLHSGGCTDSHKVVSVLWVSDNQQLPMQSDGSNGGVIYEERGPTFLESVHELLPPLLSRNIIAAIASPFKTGGDTRQVDKPAAEESQPALPPTPPVFSNKPQVRRFIPVWPSAS